ncbi:hypothetical protein PC118_g7575 [Phytophthora cactorum]|uniref:Xaa-Pro dipeptidyl-peptidase C-terminal domain-containing protein n=1 Tax=Phytophthora cactorum TaxID=29920 RepID=A0A8T1G1T4_9STRA|nr:hypothetical protein PC118_g7575 [Phytophthora cactorum]
MAEAAAASQPQAAANTKYYMKNAVFSMISLYLAHQFAGYISNREDPIACDLHVNDHSWFGERRYESLRFFDPKKTHHETQYVAMRGGVDLAVDSYLADYLWEKQQQVPTVLFPTRHGRGYTLNFPFNMFTRYERKFTNPRVNAYVQRFVTNGYAWVSVDVRGTGASAGTKEFDFADAEVQDAYDVIEWITQQPWSNGEVAVFGQGLDGVGALLAAASGHPALKAVSVNSAPVDVFQDALFPGGVKNDKALNDWASFTGATDRQIRWDNIPTFKPRLMLKHFGGEVYRVDDDDAKFDNYIYQHTKNPDLSKELKDVHFLDQPDVNLVAYLEDVDYTAPFPNENKRPGVTYITEALLNPVHKTIRPDSSVHSFKRADSREIVPGQVYEAVFRFQPTSYVVKRDHQIRVSVGVASPPDFGSAGEKEATKLTIHFGGAYPTKLTLPSYTGVYNANVVPRAEVVDDLESIPTESTEKPAEQDEVDEFAEVPEAKDEL